MELAQVDEKIFYGQVIHDDLDDIVKNIRDDQKRAYLVCETLKINYDKLPEEEKRALEKVCKKSPLMLSVINQRGKVMFQSC